MQKVISQNNSQTKINPKDQILPVIIMDERERGSIRKMILQFPCEVKIHTLPVADYVLSSEIAIERKRGDDLVASICDNRFFSQLTNLTYHYKKPAIILENYEKMFERGGVLPASIYGAIIYAVYKMGVSILPTRNEKDTATLLWSLARRIQSPIMKEGKKFEYQFIAPIHPVIDKSAQIYFLEGFLGVSEKRAENLLNFFKTPWNLIETLKNINLQGSTISKKENIPNSDLNLSKLKGFGPKFFRTNQNLLLSEFKTREI